MKTTIEIGYWANRLHPEYPTPVADSVTNPELQQLIIAKLRNAYATNRMPSYRGWSTCRLCGMNNGSKELVLNVGDVTYRIPQGYLHYLTEHNVEADSRLLHIL